MNATGETIRVAEVNGHRLRHAVSMAGSDCAWIVFSNSLMTDLEIWNDQVAALRSGYNILRYDQPGHGGSSVPSGPVDFDLLGGCLVGLLDQLGVSRSVAVGLSMGVPTVLAAYRAQPSRFAALVVVDGQCRTAAGGRQTWEDRIAFVERHGMAKMGDATVERWLQPPARIDERGARLRAMIAATPPAGFIACAHALQDYDLSDALDGLDVPLLAVAGALDGAMPETMRKIFSNLPGARFRQIDDAGHVPNLEEPTRFNVELMTFLLQISNKL